MCNVHIQLSGDVLAAFLGDFRDVEDFSVIKSSSGTAHGDYSFTMCLNRGGFQAIPHSLDYEDQVMMVEIEGRRFQCWQCKHLGHFSRSCSQKTTNYNNTTVIASSASTTATVSSVSTTVTTTTTTTTNTTPTSKANIPATAPATTNTQSTENGDHPNNK